MLRAAVYRAWSERRPADEPDSTRRRGFDRFWYDTPRPAVDWPLADAAPNDEWTLNMLDNLPAPVFSEEPPEPPARSCLENARAAALDAARDIQAIKADLRAPAASIVALLEQAYASTDAEFDRIVRRHRFAERGAPSSLVADLQTKLGELKKVGDYVFEETERDQRMLQDMVNVSERFAQGREQAVALAEAFKKGEYPVGAAAAAVAALRALPRAEFAAAVEAYQARVSALAQKTRTLDALKANFESASAEYARERLAFEKALEGYTKRKRLFETAPERHRHAVLAFVAALFRAGQDEPECNKRPRFDMRPFGEIQQPPPPPLKQQPERPAFVAPPPAQNRPRSNAFAAPPPTSTVAVPAFAAAVVPLKPPAFATAVPLPTQKRPRADAVPLLPVTENIALRPIPTVIVQFKYIEWARALIQQMVRCNAITPFISVSPRTLEVMAATLESLTEPLVPIDRDTTLEYTMLGEADETVYDSATFGGIGGLNDNVFEDASLTGRVTLYATIRGKFNRLMQHAEKAVRDGVWKERGASEQLGSFAEQEKSLTNTLAETLRMTAETIANRYAELVVGDVDAVSARIFAAMEKLAAAYRAVAKKEFTYLADMKAALDQHHAKTPTYVQPSSTQGLETHYREIFAKYPPSKQRDGPAMEQRVRQMAAERGPTGAWVDAVLAAPSYKEAKRKMV